ncbi:exosortase family protein XrtF [Flavobacterium aquariorum]|uniref:Exosortase family protein XrtF n=1 Tax=Flavobacterium aquariorum TaxID=2217670 RepID=A0A2W7U8X3_9FLAO|nr:exosortase family protein XrtF [Flavobacterium aquariorum]PZX93779.1 exosortase family protein XrtF [Flavobacterium aquariorum]
MKKYFVQYKPFLFFLASFFGTYVLLTLLYQFFLNGFENEKVDEITRMVAKNTEEVISWMNQSSYIVESDITPVFTIFFQNRSVAKIVEGCNGISVIILFVSFIVAFSGSLKNTLLFIFGGSLIIYILNVLRIAALSVLLYYFPNQSHLLHGVLFPLMIYGLVFILWVIWVNKFSKYAK